MREIKFRAWNEKSKTMLNWEWLIDRFSLYDLFKKKYILDWPLSPMQYTGLKDKNGVEVYEGDIVKCRVSFGVASTRFIGVVAVDMISGATINGVKQYKDRQSFAYKAFRLEIIGNIYENPELLGDNDE